MRNMTIKNIEAAIDGDFRGSAALDTEITDVVIDTRLVTQGCLFVPIKGARVDGHDLIPDAIAAGAACVLSERELGFDVPYIMVRSTHDALLKLAEFYRSQFDIPLIGVTGSSGKTSVKEMIASTLSQHFKVHKTSGNHNNDIGLPLTLFGIDETDGVAVTELGISHFGEMDVLAQCAMPTAGVITNIGVAHMENLLSRDGILKEKTSICKHMKNGGKLYVCGDDDKLAGFSCENKVCFGFGENNDARIVEFAPDGILGSNAVFEYCGRKIVARIPVPGKHMALNAAAAVAIGVDMGLSDDEIAAGIASFYTVGNRFHVVKTNYLTVVDDCYNANPESMRASLDVLSTVEGRRVAILGDMYELGVNEAAMHREVGEYAKKLGIELLVTVGELGKEIAAGFGDAAVSFDNKQELIESISGLLRTGDTVLVKASRGMGLESVTEALLNKCKEEV